MATMMVRAAVQVGGAGAMVVVTAPPAWAAGVAAVLPALGIAVGGGGALLLIGWGLHRMLRRRALGGG
jgi:hypothetical protein